MQLKSLAIIVVLSVLAFFHISFMFEKFRSDDEGDFTTALFLIPVIALYPLIFRYVNDRIIKKDE